jgi:pectate lyase
MKLFFFYLSILTLFLSCSIDSHDFDSSNGVNHHSSRQTITGTEVEVATGSNESALLNASTVLEANPYITITDPVPGWASTSGGTTGGGTNLSAAITVSTFNDLQNAVAGTTPKIILVKPGIYIGSLLVGANKTIIGTEPGVVIQGRIELRADKKDILKNYETYNNIIRNIAVKGNKCNSYEECSSGEDAVTICGGTHHIWLDHVDISDGQDGNFDITVQSDLVTASWCKYHYTYDKNHRFSNLIGDSEDRAEDKGKLKTTLMYSWWGEGVAQRMPRGRYAQVHSFNNYYTTKDPDTGSYCFGPGEQMTIIVENSEFDLLPGFRIIHKFSNPTGWKLSGNIGNVNDLNQQSGSIFTIPYKYDLYPASSVKAAITAKAGGAGNTCVFQKDGSTGVVNRFTFKG